MRYFGSSSGPQIQFTKSCDVAIGAPMIVTNPTDAVLDRQTVPAGWTTADELATPAGLICSSVSQHTRPSSFLISLRFTHEIPPFQ